MSDTEITDASKPPTAPRGPLRLITSSEESGAAGTDFVTFEDLEILKKRIVEDDRMDALFRMGQNLTEKFDNRAYLHPHGMADFDYRSVSVDRKPRLEAFKHQTRKENYRYLSENPEIDAMMAIFLRKILHSQPADVVHFAADFFTRETMDKNFQVLLQEEKDRLSRYRVNKMKAAGKITTIQIVDGLRKRSAHSDACKRKAEDEKAEAELREALADPSKVLQMQEGVLNWLKKLNIGPLAQDIDTREKPPPPAPKKKPIVEKAEKKKYCGCKDPGRREKAHPKNEVSKNVPAGTAVTKS